uniref:Somatolactin n=1 Tax=Fundulus heteroclitus TaxID=8078 RepID=A0A3Q2PPI9_FUNHE
MNMKQNNSVAWALLLWSQQLTASTLLDCRDDQGSLSRCTSISQEKLLDRVIHHAELIYRVSEELCSLFEELFIPFPFRLQSNQAAYACITRALPIPSSKSEIQQISMLDESTLSTVQSDQGTVQNDVQPEVLESVLRDYSLLTCFKKDAHKMETFLKLLKCRQTDKYNCA